MPKIKWKGIIKSENDFPSADITINAKKLNVEEDIKKMQLKALPFMIPSVLILLICMFLKTFIAGEIIVNFWFIFIGFTIGFLLMIVHELLHAIAYPKNAIVYILELCLKV